MRRSGGHGEEAQALVELAIMITVLLLFFLGAIDFGRFIYYSDAIRSAARVGADVASNHCPFAGYSCGTTDQGAAVTDTYIVWATYCEAQYAVNLNLGQYTVGKPNSSPVSTLAYTTNGSLGACQASHTDSSWTPTCNTAAGAACSSCANDICVSSATPRTSGTDVTVSVGYDFQPISPIMQKFFPAKSCYTGDSTLSNRHTICATAVGRVY